MRQSDTRAWVRTGVRHRDETGMKRSDAFERCLTPLLRPSAGSGAATSPLERVNREILSYDVVGWSTWASSRRKRPEQFVAVAVNDQPQQLA
jgi:hypothetical protein